MSPEQLQALNTTLSRQVEAAMHSAGLSQRRLAALAGVTEGTIRRILEGKGTRTETLEKIAEALALEVDALITSHRAA